MNNINNEFINLTKKADNLDIHAINTLCDYYTNDYHLMQTFNNELLDFYKTNNGPYSTFYYGYILYNNLLNDINYNDNLKNEGLQLIIKSSSMGCAQAFFELFIMKLTDTNINIDTSLEDLVENALKYNNSNMFDYIGTEFMENNNVIFAAKYYKKAIALGNSNSMMKYGQLYHDGYMINYNNNHMFKMAKRYYNRSINKHNNHAYFNLAVMYREGDGHSKNIKKAKDLFLESSNLGNEKAMVCLGDIYYDKDKLKKAARFFKMAITCKNDPFACYKLATMYMDKFNNQNNNNYIIKAYQLFIKGAKLNFPLCITEIESVGLNINSTQDDIEKLLQ